MEGCVKREGDVLLEVGHGDADGACVRSIDEPALAAKEAKHFDPLLRWLAKTAFMAASGSEAPE